MKNDYFEALNNISATSWKDNGSKEVPGIRENLHKYKSHRNSYNNHITFYINIFNDIKSDPGKMRSATKEVSNEQYIINNNIKSVYNDRKPF